jgi:hypothetical protein
MYINMKYTYLSAGWMGTMNGVRSVRFSSARLLCDDVLMFHVFLVSRSPESDTRPLVQLGGVVETKGRRDIQLRGSLLPLSLSNFAPPSKFPL